jgi:hypothetical protein
MLEKILKIIFSFILAFLLIYLIKLIAKIRFGYSDTKSFSEDHIVTTSSSILHHSGRPAIYQNITFLRPANVPLTPFISPLKILDPASEGLPPFLLYKTDYLTDIADQQLCGSCWAFSIASMLGDRVSVNTGGEEINTLSAQQLLQCFEPDTACSGNSPEDLLMWLEEEQYHIKTAEEVSYKQTLTEGGDGDVVRKKCPLNTHGVSVKKDSVRSLTEYIEEINPDQEILAKNIEQMKQELFQNGPFFCAMTVYQDFYEYDGESIYSHSSGSPQVGGHAIEVIGYCDEGVDNREGIDNKSYWICRNSWGSEWPVGAKESGYFAIKMGSNECGVESRSGSADPSVVVPNEKIKLHNMRIMRYEAFDSFLMYNREGMFS